MSIFPDEKNGYWKKIKNLPRNVWAVSLTSFFMDISSEMIINILPLFLSNVLGMRTVVIGAIEGIAEATSSVLKIFSGWFSDRLKSRKGLAVLGYTLSAVAKPFFYFANSAGMITGIRVADRIGKGIRTAPRDALVADSVETKNRGVAFGFQRAADTAGAMVGLIIALGVVWFTQQYVEKITRSTFQLIVLISIIPAFLAVLSLVLGTKETRVEGQRQMPKFAFKALGKNFMIFMMIVAIFDLGNSSDAFLVLRAQERGISVAGILMMLVVFNLVYTVTSLPAGSLSDRVGRKKVILGGWLVYALIYMGFALAKSAAVVWLLYICYGFYYGLSYGTTKALVADLVSEELRGTAYGTYNAVLGVLDFPASLIAGLLWQGAGNWAGFGPSAPFWFGGGMALLAVALMAWWLPKLSRSSAAV